MKNTIKYITSFIFFLTLSGCSIFVKDCTRLSGDRESYRACTASQGNQQAQYELGLAAYGQGDYKVALKWLKLAATPNSGRTAVYMPPVGGATYGTVMMMDTGQATAGHGQAQALLAEMYDKGLGVKKDTKQADRYRGMANNNWSVDY